MDAKNIIFEQGHGIKKIGYKSLRGFIKIIKSQNKKLKKMGYSVQFTINLPIKD